MNKLKYGYVIVLFHIFQIQGEGEEEVIKLVPVQIFARDLLILLNEAGGRMLLMNFESFYLNRFGKNYIAVLFHLTFACLNLAYVNPRKRI